jgi:triacylglycerol lipase
MDWCVDNIGIGKLRQQERQASHAKANRGDKPNKATEAERRASALSFSNLTSLPSSVTTLLLSTVDTPAYANLTTSYLNDVFNPSTPNDPKVKYFSVTSRVSSVSVLHPFWFTKLVVDSFEEKERTRLAAAALASGESWKNLPKHGKLPTWADERQWGNDGLVTVQSAQWGEFLGILDNCDRVFSFPLACECVIYSLLDWEMRGARGLEFGVDLPAIPALGLGTAPLPTSLDEPGTSPRPSTRNKSDAWYIGEWTRFVGGWRRGTEKDGSSPAAKAKSTAISNYKPTSTALTSTKDKKEEKRRRQVDFTKGDQVVRASTDKLSTMFDWIVDQVPNTQALPEVITLPAKLFPSSSKKKSEKGSESSSMAKAAAEQDEIRKLGVELVRRMVAGSSESFPPLKLPLNPKPETLATEMKKVMEREKKSWKRNELAKRDDLERFYISLSRKMWEEGL